MSIKLNKIKLTHIFLFHLKKIIIIFSIFIILEKIIFKSDFDVFFNFLFKTKTLVIKILNL